MLRNVLQYYEYSLILTFHFLDTTCMSILPRTRWRQLVSIVFGGAAPFASRGFWGQRSNGSREGQREQDKLTSTYGLSEHGGVRTV